MTHLSMSPTATTPPQLLDIQAQSYPAAVPLSCLRLAERLGNLPPPLSHLKEGESGEQRAEKPLEKGIILEEDKKAGANLEKKLVWRAGNGETEIMIFF